MTKASFDTVAGLLLVVALACCYSSLSYCLWCSVRRLRDSSGDGQAAFMAGR